MRISDWSSDVCSSDLAEPLQHGLGAADHALQLVGRLLRRGDRDQLDLVELVLAQHAAGVAAGRAGLRAETGRQRADVQRQSLGGEDRVGHQDRTRTRLNSSHYCASRMPSSAWKKKNHVQPTLTSTPLSD